MHLNKAIKKGSIKSIINILTELDIKLLSVQILNDDMLKIRLE